ncbi:SRPBCC domain-containing protein [Tabrizicola sp. M-4]|uniref:SRPBCC domain-containing protein n=1 Tax=Tabrizicola sp. M-4 TaxID=3055847 RepID=UPI003DA7DCC0
MDLSDRTMTITRVIAAPVALVWGAWWNADSLPQWWGPEGFSCRTARIDLREGGEWLFDMIGPDGAVWPNHHRYGRVTPGARIDYALHAGEDGPKHADATALFEEVPEGTRITLTMVFNSAEEWAQAKGFGAEELGLQTLGKLAARIGAS